jgi:hypothetical protein
MKKTILRKNLLMNGLSITEKTTLEFINIELQKMNWKEILKLQNG